MKYFFMGLLSVITLTAGGLLITKTWIGGLCIVAGGLLAGHIAAVADKLNKD